MSKFLLTGLIIGFAGAAFGFIFEKEWGMYVTIIGTLIALTSLFGY